MSYAVLQEAIRVLGVGERASLGEIKTRHRELVKRHHPDTSPEGESDTIRKINAAYQVLQAYVAEYRFSFAEEAFYEQNPEERVWQQFADDPLCGNRLIRSAISIRMPVQGALTPLLERRRFRKQFVVCYPDKILRYSDGL